MFTTQVDYETAPSAIVKKWTTLRMSPRFIRNKRLTRLSARHNSASGVNENSKGATYNLNVLNRTQTI